MELQREASSIAAKPLSERVYCYSCIGRNGRKPHPPIIVVYEVIEDYDNGKIPKNCSIKIFQYVQDEKLDVFRNYKEYIRRRNPRKMQESEDGPKEKDRHNPYIGIFKCIFCGQKPRINYKLMKKLHINDGRLLYGCSNHGNEHDISFILEKVEVVKEKEGNTLPLPPQLFRNEQVSWENWVRSYFEMKVKVLQIPH